MFREKGFLKNFANFTGKHLRQKLFFTNLFEKQTLVQVFFREFCEIFNSTCFYRTPLVDTSVV